MEEQVKQEEVVETVGNESVEDVESVEQTSDDTSHVEVEEKVYTQADIDALQAQIDELQQYKPQELSEQEVKLQEKAQLLWEKEISQTLKDEGLDIFIEFIRADVDDTDALQSQISKLKEIVGALELSNSYQPTNHKPVDGYSLAKKKKDVKGMIGEKLNLK
ncbi:xanthine phosphoribosyltransferase [Niallia circulans]|uniref:xanthine phosphoribosyltransferase n=1 Tax=Niallia circulans TaxID=1397 RepID=UPI002E1CC835|nr:xanthine phosphoribosyltransferase [Niallia circulans]